MGGGECWGPVAELSLPRCAILTAVPKFDGDNTGRYSDTGLYL